MLRIEMDFHWVMAAQQAYVARGTIQDAHLVKEIIALRKAFQHGISSFSRNQMSAEQAGRPYVADGRAATLDDLVFGRYAKWPWPSLRTGILQGLQMTAAEPMPNEPRRPGGRAIREIDPHSYLVRLDEGPPQQREYGHLSAVAIYFDPLRLIRILWIGAEVDEPRALDAISWATKRFTVWRSIAPEYDDWLWNHG